MKLKKLFVSLTICLWVQPAIARPPKMSTVIASSGFKAAAAALGADHNHMIDENIKLTEIPAPPFKEQVRARAFAQMMRESGLTDITIDEIGNVIAIRPGANRKLPPLVLAAHLDTVFPEGTDVRVKREGTKLYAPGITDDSRPLAELLAFVRAMRKANIRTERDIIFVADVGEEGAGDLRGIRHLFTNNTRAKSATAFITIEVTGFDDIQNVGLGSKRFEVKFAGPGGHSNVHFGIVNPLLPLAAVITKMYEMKVPTEPKTTYGATIVAGGTSVNAIPAESFLSVDLRSAGNAELVKMETDFRAIVAEAVVHENQIRDTSRGRITADIKTIGDRPAGFTDPHNPLVTSAVDAARAFGYQPRLGAFSSDANLPASLGIPAISIGSGAVGGRQHSLDEFLDVAEVDSLRGMRAGLATVLATAGVVQR